MTSVVGTGTERQTILAAFEAFRDDIDQQNDRRERLIKLSRSATILSKRIIFLLHRVAVEDVEDEQAAIASAVQQSHPKFKETIDIFDQMRGELEGENFWRHQKVVSSSLQEYIEALSFSHYLQHKTLVTFVQVQDNLKNADGVPLFPLPYTDYLLGVSDLTGELMRFVITSIGRKGIMSKANFERATEVCSFIRDCKSDWEPLTPYIRELGHKQDVTTKSLMKLEEAVCSIAIRGLDRAGMSHFSPNRPSDLGGRGTPDRDDID